MCWNVGPGAGSGIRSGVIGVRATWVMTEPSTSLRSVTPAGIVKLNPGTRES